MIAALAAALLAASCSSDDDNGSSPGTTTATTGGTTAETTPSTEAPSETTPSTEPPDSTQPSTESTDVNENTLAQVPTDEKPLQHDSLTCTYRPHEVIAASDEATMAAIVDIVGGVDDTPLSGEGGPDLGLSLYTYAPGTGIDPLDVATTVFNNTGSRAAPNYIYAFAPFWTYAPGDTPVPVSEPAPVEPLSDTNEISIAVLDTGYVAGEPPSPNVTLIRSTPPAAASGLPTSPDDVMNGVAAGHGTFIVDMLGRLLPSAQITAVAIDPRTEFDNAFPAPDQGGTVRAVDIRDDATLTLAFTEALARDPDYINLSLGSYGCSGVSPGDLESEPYYVPIGLGTAFEALDTMHASGETDVQVFAAAGNDGHGAGHAEVFYPAGWAPDRDWLTSVGSNPLPDGTVYSNQGPWVEVQALGSKVISRRPPPASDPSQIWYAWSGTSFATPCALAMHAAGENLTLFKASGADFLDCGINS